MAIVKHIKSRNANYSAAINYLLFEHDEKTGKKIVDESGRSILRKEFYMDVLNCDPMSFDKKCELTFVCFRPDGCLELPNTLGATPHNSRLAA